MCGWPCDVAVAYVPGKQSLNEYIEHYEGLSYSTEALHSKHVRAKRSLNTAVNLHFISHGRCVKTFTVISCITVESHGRKPFFNICRISEQ